MALLLARYAAHVDNARRIFVPRERALHSVLYAAILRGRPYLSTDSGARELFDEARRYIEAGRDPLYDIVVDRDGEFACELALLENERPAYERDLQRARRTIVFVPKPIEPFPRVYETLANEPLLDEKDELRPIHLRRMDGEAAALRRRVPSRPGMPLVQRMGAP